jgi:hypothetical protein
MINDRTYFPRSGARMLCCDDGLWTPGRKAVLEGMAVGTSRPGAVLVQDADRQQHDIEPWAVTRHTLDEAAKLRT